MATNIDRDDAGMVEASRCLRKEVESGEVRIYDQFTSDVRLLAESV